MDAPKGVENASVSVDYVTMEVSVSWLEPENLGTFTAVDYYIVEWGIFDHSQFRFGRYDREDVAYPECVSSSTTVVVEILVAVSETL